MTDFQLSDSSCVSGDSHNLMTSPLYTAAHTEAEAWAKHHLQTCTGNSFSFTNWFFKNDRMMHHPQDWTWSLTRAVLCHVYSQVVKLSGSCHCFSGRRKYIKSQKVKSSVIKKKLLNLNKIRFICSPLTSAYVPLWTDRTSPPLSSPTPFPVLPAGGR